MRWGDLGGDLLAVVLPHQVDAQVDAADMPALVSTWPSST